MISTFKPADLGLSERLPRLRWPSGQLFRRTLIGVAITVTLSLSSAADVVRVPVKSKGAGPLFQIRAGNKWGYMERTGRVVIPPQFDDEGDFFGGFAKVAADGHWGYINEAGRFVIPRQFEHAGDFKEGLAPVQSGRRWGFIDTSGKFVIPAQFQAASDFSEGLAQFEIWERISCGRIGSFTKEDAPIWVFRMHDAGPVIPSGCYPSQPRFGFVDKRGHIAVAPKLADASDFSEGLAVARPEQPSEPKWGFIDKTGKMVIEPQFDEAAPFSDGLAAVEIGFRAEDEKKVAGKWGFIDRNGKFAIPPQFESASNFSEGLASVSSGPARWGFIDKRGVFVVPVRFTKTLDFAEGLALVWDGEGGDEDADLEPYFIDRTGKKVLQLGMSAFWPFSDGLTVIGTPGEQKYVDRRGKVVAPYDRH